VEASLQQRQDRAATLGVDRTRQGQVEPKVFEHVRVAPAIEILDLAFAQTGAQSLLPFVRGERTTKSVEGHHAVRCQSIERDARLGRDDGNESRERSDDRLDRRQRSGDGGKSFEFRRQIRFGERRQEMKRRLQRRVKSVFARLVGELRPFGSGKRDVLRMAEPFAAVAIIAEEAGAEAIESGIGRRHEIERVSWLVHGRFTSFAGPPRAHRAVTMMSARARCTTRPATMAATTRGCCPTGDGSTMIKSARWPRAICPRSLSWTALAGVCDTNAQACPNGRTPRRASAKAASSGAG